MKRIQLILIFISTFSLTVFISLTYAQDRILTQTEIGKSLKNPNPPKTNIDKKIIDMSKLILGGLIEKNPKYIYENKEGSRHSFQQRNLRLNTNESCIQDNECLKNTRELQLHKHRFISKIGKLAQIKNGHIIKWSLDQTQHSYNQTKNTIDFILLDDEFVVHFHVKNTYGIWYDLNLIFTESIDKERFKELSFQRFFAKPVPRFPNDYTPTMIMLC